MEDSVENEYIVTDENGCATDPSIFGEWEYNGETNSLLASFNAFKFPSSDNIRFQCNIRVCFGKCQPVNCRGYNAFGRRRRRRQISDGRQSNTSNTALSENDLGILGQLREEITISSNPILTFERRDERLSDGSQSKYNDYRTATKDLSIFSSIFTVTSGKRSYLNSPDLTSLDGFKRNNS